MTGDTLREIADAYGNFADATVEEVRVGPRREVTLIVSPLVWRGSQSEEGPPVAVRFGGIEEFPRVAEQFRRLPALESDIGYLGADRGGGKPGRYRLRFEAERRDYAFTFRCSSVTVTRAGERQ